MSENRNPEQIARDHIDDLLKQAGWKVQSVKKINLNDGIGQAVREYQTDVGPADYVLFVNKRAVGVIEAKREEEGHRLTVHEGQTEGYAGARLKWVSNKVPLPFLYESTGVVTRFTDQRDPKPRSREVFTFHRPETLLEWFSEGNSIRERLQLVPLLNPKKLPAQELNLRDCQEAAIDNLEVSFKAARPRALIQMATGAGKTYTAITAIYRLLKYSDAKRILFLVDTKNLGEQAEQEMMSYVPMDDNRKFTELYNVQRLKSSSIAKDSHVCISTIQRLYSILKDKPLDEALEEINPAEMVLPKEPLPVVYSSKVPPEFFDFIFIDECHRSIYNLWRQVLDYYDAFQIGLTATPDTRAIGYFNRNIVSEYSHEHAVADGVNVGNEVYLIETDITKRGAQLRARQLVEKREIITRKKRWEQQDEDIVYSAKQLDKNIVNRDQIRTVLGTFRMKLPEIFPGRKEVPKTLIFAKTDSHADDIIQIVREVFDEGNAFCKKLTYKSEDDPKSVLAEFRTCYHPRIAVTVDMVATGTDVKPLECLLFMRDVKSRNYFEQMKGRGTRTLELDDLRKVTPSAVTAKTHYVIVDAIGVTTSLKTASQPLITKPTVSLKDLAMGVMMGVHDQDTVSSLAGRLARLNRQLSSEELQKIKTTANGVELCTIVSNLLAAIDADKIEAKALQLAGSEHGEPEEQHRQQAQEQLVSQAANVFTGPLIELIDKIRRDKEQTIDHVNLDRLESAGWDTEAAVNAQAIVDEFAAYLTENQDRIEALKIYFSQPYRRRELTFDLIKQVYDTIITDKPKLAPLRVWDAFSRLDDYKGGKPISELSALVGLIRRVCGMDSTLTAYDDIIRRNFQNWILKRHSGKGDKFNEEQMEWLRMIRDHVISSMHIDRDDLELAPFDGKGGLGKMYQLFGDSMDNLIDEMNEAMAA
jgi:type I restriction enzyme R subunit